MHRSFSPSWHCHSHLGWEKVFASPATNRFHQALAREAPQHLANGDRSDPPARLWDSHQTSSSQEGGGCHACLAVAEKCHDGKEVVDERISAAREARVSEVLNSQA